MLFNSILIVKMSEQDDEDAVAGLGDINAQLAQLQAGLGVSFWFFGVSWKCKSGLLVERWFVEFATLIRHILLGFPDFLTLQIAA